MKCNFRALHTKWSHKSLVEFGISFTDRYRTNLRSLKNKEGFSESNVITFLIFSIFFLLFSFYKEEKTLKKISYQKNKWYKKKLTTLLMTIITSCSIYKMFIFNVWSNSSQVTFVLKSCWSEIFFFYFFTSSMSQEDVLTCPEYFKS